MTAPEQAVPPSSDLPETMKTMGSSVCGSEEVLEKETSTQSSKREEGGKALERSLSLKKVVEITGDPLETMKDGVAGLETMKDDVAGLGKGEELKKTEKLKLYSSVVIEKSMMHKFDVEVKDVDGIGTIQVPDSVFENAPPLWEDCILGKFMEKAPHVGLIHMTVNKIWTLGDKSIKIDVMVVDERTIKFKIPDSAIRARVLRRGMWSFKNIPMIVSKWSPVVEEAQPVVTSIPMWVVVRNVPRSMFSWKGLSFLTSPLGEPKKLHPDTLWCKNFEEARVFVEVNLNKKLPEFYSFKLNTGVQMMVHYEFPWLPPRCLSCAKWGHISSDCKAAPGDYVILRKDSDAPKKTHVGNKEKSPQQDDKLKMLLSQSISRAENQGGLLGGGPTSPRSEVRKTSEAPAEPTATSSSKLTKEVGWEKAKAPVKASNLAVNDMVLPSITLSSSFASLSDNEAEEDISDDEEQSPLDTSEALSATKPSINKDMGSRIMPPRASKAAHKYLVDASNPNPKESPPKNSNKKKKKKNKNNNHQ